jgi:hypothetical protein
VDPDLFLDGKSSIFPLRLYTARCRRIEYKGNADAALASSVHHCYSVASLHEAGWLRKERGVDGFEIVDRPNNDRIVLNVQINGHRFGHMSSISRDPRFVIASSH